MSAAAPTKIFGLKVNVDRRILYGALAAVVALVFWLNMRSSSDEPTETRTVQPDASVTPAPVPALRLRARSRREPATDRGQLRIMPVDASDGRIDPTLRLDFLARLNALKEMTPGRSLFEIGASMPVAVATAIHGPKVPVNMPSPMAANPNVQTASMPPPQPMANIPLRFFGFAKPASKGELNRGLFLDGDNILVAREGEVLQGKYLVVELTGTSAKLEDMQLRLGQTLPVAPEAAAQ